MSQRNQQPGDMTRSVKVRVEVDGPHALAEALRTAFEEASQEVGRINRKRRERRATDVLSEQSDRAVTLEYQGPAEAFAGLVERRADTVIDF